jgi:acetylornithine/N-succinyldiaminopimelate aminotransferase
MEVQQELTAAQVIAAEREHIVQTYKRGPMVLSHGQGLRLWDTEGKEYLDFMAGIAVNALGHSDPGIVTVITAQAGKLIHTSNLYYTAPQVQLAEKLTGNSFADRVFFTNSGTEANEGAIKFARKFAKINGGENKIEIVCFDHAFHGRTMGSLALTPKEIYQAPFRPLMPGAVIAPFNDIKALRTFIGSKTCAVFVEPVQGEGGVNAATPEFLQALRERCNEVDALLVADEVQCGLGRTGDLWAHTASGITPDMMTLAKPLAGGLPIGAILATERVASVMGPGEHGSTFAGGPLTCAVASYVVDRIKEPAFLQHVRETGQYLRERLEEVNSPHVKEVRGRGLMLGVELDIEAAGVIAKGYEQGVIMVNAGTNVLRLVPALITEKQHVDIFIERLSAVLAEM